MKKLIPLFVFCGIAAQAASYPAWSPWRELRRAFGPMFPVFQVRIPGPGGSVPAVAGGPPALAGSVCGPTVPSVGGGASAAIGTLTGTPNLVVIVSLAYTSVPPTDSTGSNTYVLVPPGDSTGAVNSAIFYAESASITSATTFTYTGGQPYPQFCVFAFTNMATSGVYETGTFAKTDAGGAAMTLPPTTPSFSGHNVFVTGAFGSPSMTGASISGSFSSPIVAVGVPGAGYAAAASYLFQSGTASQAPIWSATPSGESYEALIAVFQGAN